MKQHTIPYGKIFGYLAVIVAAAGLAGYVWVKGMHAHLIAIVPVMLFCIARLVLLYGEIVQRLRFILNAVQNDDYSFRFTENPERTKYALVNYSLNRIKEVLDKTKLQIREKERYFELITECANIGIITIAENGTVMQANTKALHIIGMAHLIHIDQLRPLGNELHVAMRDIHPDEQRTVRMMTEIGDQSLVLSCSEMVFNKKVLRVVSLGNIHEELDSKEVESWEKLTRILTHEIMNSLAPVTSISHTLLVAQSDATTVRRGLETIHTTSDRLMRFVDSFRAFTRIPTPQKAPFFLAELINEALSLIPHEGITVTVDLEPADTMLYADRTLMSQVLVNLLKNGVEALMSEPLEERRITIRSTIDAEERIQIELTNNGSAIPPEVAENIFTPFFTTKEEGSGIGLAVSRQIVRLHGGSLRLKHNLEGRITFVIVLD